MILAAQPKVSVRARARTCGSGKHATVQARGSARGAGGARPQRLGVTMAATRRGELATVPARRRARAQPARRRAGHNDLGVGEALLELGGVGAELDASVAVLAPARAPGIRKEPVRHAGVRPIADHSDGVSPLVVVVRAVPHASAGDV